MTAIGLEWREETGHPQSLFTLIEWMEGTMHAVNEGIHYCIDIFTKAAKNTK